MNKNIAVLLTVLVTLNIFAADEKKKNKGLTAVEQAVSTFIKKSVRSEKQLNMIPVINPIKKDKYFTAFTLLSGDIVYESRLAAEQDGFTFNEKNEFEPFEVVLVPRKKKEEYSWALVIGSVHGFPVLQLAPNSAKGGIKKKIGKYNPSAPKVEG